MIDSLKRDWSLVELKAIEDYEEKTGLKLPEDYREFLLKHNGGYSKNYLNFEVQEREREREREETNRVHRDIFRAR